MSAEWKKLKTEIGQHVDQLKSKLEPEYSSDPKKTSVIVLTKFKDNAKEATVSVAPKEASEEKVELTINLQSKNLAKQFENLFADFKSKS